MTDKVHLYLEIEKSEAVEYGQELSKSLNEIAKRQGEVISINQTVVSQGDSPGVYVRIAQIVFRVNANLTGSARGIEVDQGGFVDSF